MQAGKCSSSVWLVRHITSCSRTGALRRAARQVNPQQHRKGAQQARAGLPLLMWFTPALEHTDAAPCCTRLTRMLMLMAYTTPQAAPMLFTQHHNMPPAPAADAAAPENPNSRWAATPTMGAPSALNTPCSITAEMQNEAQHPVQFGSIRFGSIRVGACLAYVH